MNRAGGLVGRNAGTNSPTSSVDESDVITNERGNDDIEENVSKEIRVTPMEEVLLLGLKDNELDSFNRKTELNNNRGSPEAKKACKCILATSSSFDKQMSQIFETKHHDENVLSGANQTPSSLASTDAAVILDLSNDLLEEVFKHLKLIDLCAVAEVCSRFEQIAKTWFKNSEKTDLTFMDIRSDGDSEDKIVFKTSKILQHFGAHFSKFDGADLHDGNKGSYCRENQEFERKIFELLIRYCSGNLTELTFFGIEVTEEWLPSMRPLLECLQVLEIEWLRTCQAFLDTFPLWLTKLKKLRLRFSIKIHPEAFGPNRPPSNEIWVGQVLRFDSLQQPEMEEIFLWSAINLTNHDIEEILKHNPQLKKIDLFCCPKLNHKIFDFIANHVPDIEYLHITDIVPEQRQIQHFGQFRNLRSIKLHYDFTTWPKSKFIVLLIDQLTEANIPLKTLNLRGIDFFGERSRNRLDAKRFVDGVSKLKSLNILKLGKLEGLSSPHHYVICTNLPDLREISLETLCPLTPALISGIIRGAHKLEWLHLASYKPDKADSERPTVDSGNFNEWMGIITNRTNETPLEMWLCAGSYTTSHTIPVRASKGKFTLFIGKHLLSPENIDYEGTRKRPRLTSGFVSDF